MLVCLYEVNEQFYILTIFCPISSGIQCWILPGKNGPQAQWLQNRSVFFLSWSRSNKCSVETINIQSCWERGMLVWRGCRLCLINTLYISKPSWKTSSNFWAAGYLHFALLCCNFQHGACTQACCWESCSSQWMFDVCITSPCYCWGSTPSKPRNCSQEMQGTSF